MKHLTLSLVAAGGFAAVAVALAGPAAAAPLGGTNADVTAQNLRAQGFDVRVNGAPTVSLSQCTVTDVHGLAGNESGGRPIDPTRLATVFLDVSCHVDN